MISPEIIQAAKDVPPTDNWMIRTKKLSEDELREIIKNNHNVNLTWISMYQTLSEDFIREFSNMVDWYWVSICQKLSDGLIIEFKHVVNWYWISKRQRLSPVKYKYFLVKQKESISI